MHLRARGDDVRDRVLLYLLGIAFQLWDRRKNTSLRHVWIFDTPIAD